MTARPMLVLALADADVTAAVREKLPLIEVRDWASLASPFHMVGRPLFCVVDWLLPTTSGLELCRELRSTSATAEAHITLVIEDNDAVSRRRALKSGADTYMVGPATSEMIVGRFANPAHATPAIDGEFLARGALQLDTRAYRVSFHGRAIEFRPQEMALLKYFMQQPDRVHSREELARLLSSGKREIDVRTVDVCVGRVRRALRASGAPDPLRTVRNVGYVFDSV